jgi:WD40 repeat protein
MERKGILISSLEFNSAGDTLYGYTLTNHCYTWRTGDGKLLQDKVVPTVPTNVRSAEFSVSGIMFMTGSVDHMIRMWRETDKKIIRKFHGHKSNIGVISLSKDGQYLVSGSDDGMVKIWDLNAFVGWVNRSSTQESSLNSK